MELEGEETYQSGKNTLHKNSNFLRADERGRNLQEKIEGGGVKEHWKRTSTQGEGVNSELKTRIRDIYHQRRADEESWKLCPVREEDF